MASHNRKLRDYDLEIDEEALAKLIAPVDDLERALDRLGVWDERSRRELLPQLERAWHVMRVARVIEKVFGENVRLAGGSVVNYIILPSHNEMPRFTYDLDLGWRRPARSKSEVLEEVMSANARFMEIEEAVKIANRNLYILKHDVERDRALLPFVIPLRYPVLMRYTGRPFHEYLEIREYEVIRKLRRVFKNITGYTNILVDEVLVEISFGLEYPETLLDTHDVFGYRHNAIITEPEFHVILKLKPVVERWREEDILKYLHEYLKLALDLRIARYLDKRKMKGYLERELRGVNLGEVTWRLERSLRAVKEMGSNYYRGASYTLIRARKSLDEIIEDVLAIVKDVVDG
jgi:hypothetical protein